MHKSVLLLAVLTFSVACSKHEKNLQNITEVKDQTNLQSDTPTPVSAKAHYQELITNDSIVIRDAQVEKLLSENDKYKPKLAAAATLYKSFEFQLWNNDSKDADLYLEQLQLSAVEEFTQNLSPLYKEINTKKMSPISKEKKINSAERSFYALAATMDVKQGVNNTSFYDLVSSALRKDFNLEEASAHEKLLVAGKNKEMMLELLKARVDMLSALALRNLTDESDMTLNQKAKKAIFKLTGGSLGSIDLPEVYNKANDATKDQTINLLADAQQTRDLLKEIDGVKKLEKTLKSAYKEIDLQDPHGTKESMEPRKAAIRSLIDGLLQ